ncbi:MULTISPECIES: DUF3987 domain-containing protein [unclassified Microcoleus]|uniref:DUF3987 domain-containing protein n=1 Tax=unclassified Microcoleus TaxID=2642155 RepID=UPI002FD6B86E
MYDNSTPIGGKVSRVHGNLVSSSKSNPCPVCGRTKDRDCRISLDGKMVLCHQNFDHTKTQQPDLWHFDGTSSDNRCGVYVFKEKTTKDIRPKDTRSWEYPDRNGSRLVRVVRVDDGEGNKKIWQEHWDGSKWQKGLGDVARASIPVYRYADVQKAIASNETIYLVEGEPCADLLWKLGMPATTNIGGGGKFTLTDSLDLQNAKVIVIVPDRDKKGIEHADKLAEHFPDAMWLYPFPESKAWENLPEKGGLDIFDWIDHEKLSASQVKAAIGEKKVFKTSPQAAAKVLNHPKFETSSLENLGDEIDALLEADLKRSTLKLEILKLSEKYRRQEKEIWHLYKTKEEEQEQADNREDVATEVARLLNSKKSQINIAEIIPPDLATPINKLAKMLNLKPECYLTTLLTQVSSLFKVGSEIKLRNDTNYRVTPNYFAGIVAESSQKKSPIMREIIDRPMQPLRERARKDFDKAQEAYEKELATWKAPKGEDKGVAPKPPRQKLYSFSKTTGEGILYQVAEHPDQALMYRCDELAGLFKSANQYRGGKGSDDEDLLEFWNGTGSTVLRASGVKADLDGLLLSVFGTIQPDVLAALLKDCSDSNGKFARFDFVIQPLAASKLSLDDTGSFDLTPMLTDLYQKIDALPALKLELEPDAKRYFTEFYNRAEDKRVAEPMQGKRAMIGKAPEKVGKLAGVLHVLNCIFNGQTVTPRIPKSIVQAAVKFVIFTANQIDVLYTEFSDRTALAPNLAKILTLAEAKGGSVSARDVTQAFDSKHRPNKQQIQEWFTELIEMKYGEVTTKGQKITFTLSPHSTVSTVAQNPDTESDTHIHTSLSTVSTVSTLLEVDRGKSVDKCGYTVDTLSTPLEPLPDKALELSVDTVDTKSVSLENSETLMMSCTTESTKPAATSTKKPRTFEIGDRVVVKDVGGIYQGARGEIVDNVYSRATGDTYLVKFDKPVRGSQQCSFEPSDLMKL